jgi:hypothetical protein
MTEKEMRQRQEEYRETSYYLENLNLLKMFIEVVLDGEIDRLMTYCFEDLKEVKGFSTPNNAETFDCDNLKISNAIYCVLWGHIFDIKDGQIGSWSNEKNGKPFRGDTINSFNTLFGDDRYGQVGFRARNRKLDTDFYLWKNVMAFRREYHTIGNFILLPNKGNVNSNRADKYVGDYFDLFLLDLKEFQQGKELRNKKLEACLNENDFYKREDMFSLLRTEFFLEDYFDESGNPKNLFGAERTFGFFERNQEKYKEFVCQYLKISEEIIRKRSLKIIAKLKIECKNEKE